MKVLKFGGTSVGSSDTIKQVLEIVKNEAASDQLVVVVSAFSGVTNQLAELPDIALKSFDEADKAVQDLLKKHEEVFYRLTGESSSDYIVQLFVDLAGICKGISLLQEVTEKSRDFIVTCGELLSSYIISRFFEKEIETSLFNAKDFLITSSERAFNKVNLNVSKEKISGIQLGKVNVFPGFIASKEDGTTTSLGRGGSDYTASILANLFDAKALQIWTDVDGIMSADPRFVRQARALQHLSYEEALELSHFGAKVIYPPSIQPALSKGIPIKIKNTFAPDAAGTLVTKEWDKKKALIQGISSIKDIVNISLSGSGMVGIPSFSARFFKALADEYINIIFITQASSEHSISIAISKEELDLAIKSLNKEFETELANKTLDPIEVEQDQAIVALVGSNMRNQVGVSGKMFNTLGKNGVSVKAIAQGSSERNISAIIQEKDLSKALNTLHESFFLSDEKVMNLFIIGVGNVGKAFIEQVQKQQSFLQRLQSLKVRIVALANSKKMIFDESGIDLENWQEQLSREGEVSDPSKFVQKITELNMRNSIFIDITASKTISALYNHLLSKSISVVTPNKLGATSPYENFKELHETSVRNQVQFLYETNVAAGLPVVSTLKDLIKSGDRIIKIEAVLSGTLNYLFNAYNTEMKFVDVVKDALQKGLTEPDPREDLLGEDVKRKILILARETGLKLEMEDVLFDSFLPESCLETASIESFYEELDKNEAHFVGLYQKANASSQKLRVVASLENKVPVVGLQSVSQDHSFYNLEGKDNIVLFYSNRYKDQPLVVKGAGAGAEVTASGIFADILKVSTD